MRQISRSSIAIHLLSVLFGSVVFICLWAVLSGCSVKSNTAATRFYHKLSARYNILYNGQNIYDEAYDSFFENITETYSRRIPTDPIVYSISESKKEGGAFDKSIEKAQKAIRLHSLRAKPERKLGWRQDPKAVAIQNKTEYNDALRDAWQMLGQSHFYNADLDQAIATFAYMTRLYATERQTRDRALLWQLRCLSLLGRSGEGRQIIAQLDTTNTERIEIVSDVYYLALSEYLLAIREYEKAIPYLVKAAQRCDNRIQRARLYYLLGQLSAEYMNPFITAHAAYDKVLSLAPPAALEFAARIRRAELSRGQTAVLRSLNAMARRSKYAQQLDQIHYAIGRTHLLSGDTLRALQSFRFAADTSKLKQDDYAMSLLAIGQISIAQRKWLQAQSAYTLAMPSLSATHPEYNYHRNISVGLDSLAPFARTAHEGDSILRLVRIPEVERRKIIDSIITALRKQRDEEERIRLRDSIASVSQALQAGAPQIAGRSTQTSFSSTDRSFYFYNPQLLEQGRRAFRQNWGQRTLEDNWRRRKRTAASTIAQSGFNASEVSADTSQASANQDAGNVDDPFTYEYYAAQLPTSPEAQKELEDQVEQSMYEMGRVLSESLDLPSESAEQWGMLLLRYPNGTHYERALYALYMMRLRLGDTLRAEALRAEYVTRYSGSSRATELASGQHIQRLHLRDSLVNTLYHQAYEAYMRGENEQVDHAYNQMKREYPTSELLPKLTFLAALGSVVDGDVQRFTALLNELSLLPNANEEIRTLAQTILGELARGRRLASSARMDLNWTRSGDYAVPSEHTPVWSWSSPKPSDRYALLAILPVESSEQSRFIFAITAYGFTQFTQESLIVSLRPATGLHLLSISGFSSNAIAERYATGLRALADSTLSGMIALPITQTNLSHVTTERDLEAYIQYLRDERPELPIDYTQAIIWAQESPKEQVELPDTTPPAAAQTITFGFDRSTDYTAEQTAADSVAVDTEVNITREASLQHRDLTYEEVQQAERDRVKAETQARKDKKESTRSRAKTETSRAPRASKGKTKGTARSP